MSAISLDSLKDSLPTTTSPCDYSLVVGDVKFPVHKSVLIECSDFFRAMLNSEMTEKYEDVFEIDDFHVETIRSIIDFAYSGKINVNDGNIVSILEAVSFLQITAFSTKVNSIQAGITVNNCIDIMRVTDLLNITEYSKEIETFIVNNFQNIAYTQKSRLTFNELLSFLEDDNLKVESEFEIVNIVKSWIGMNKAINFEELSPATKFNEEPWIQFIELMGKIRWCVIAKGVLSTKLDGGIKNAMNLIPECKSYLKEAEDYHKFVYKQPLELNVRAQPRRFKSVIATVNKSEKSLVFTDLSTNDKFTTRNVMMNGHNDRLLKIVNVNNYIFTIGYEAFKTVLSRYDPRQNEWVNLKELPSGQFISILLAHDNKLFMIGKELPHNNYLFMIRQESSVYNIAQNHISRLANNWSYACDVSAGCVVNGAIYITWCLIVGDIVISTSGFCRFNIDDNKWMNLAKMHSDRFDHTMSNIGEVIYVIGGTEHVGDICQEIERYCINENQWTICRQMFAIHSSCSYNIDGQIYLVGGGRFGDNGFVVSSTRSKVYVFSEDKDEVEELPGIDTESGH